MENSLIANLMDDHNLRSGLEQDGVPSQNRSIEDIREQLERLRDQIIVDANPDQLDASQIQGLLESLPRLTEQDIVALGHQESLCSICLNPYLAILSEEEMAIAMDSPALPIEDLGVTRLSRPWQCGHIFCRRDISKWIQEAHDSCPMCRRLLVEPGPSGAVPSEPPVDSSRPLAEFQQQIEGYINILRSRTTGIELPRNPILSENIEDGTGFSAMYS